MVEEEAARMARKGPSEEEGKGRGCEFVVLEAGLWEEEVEETKTGFAARGIGWEGWMVMLGVTVREE